MKKQEYIEMLLQDNETEPDAAKKKLYGEMIDCVEIGLSQTSVDYEIDSSIGLPELWNVIEEAGKKSRCVGPFEAAELLAKKLGTIYTRPSRRVTSAVDLTDFI